MNDKLGRGGWGDTYEKRLFCWLTFQKEKEKEEKEEEKNHQDKSPLSTPSQFLPPQSPLIAEKKTGVSGQQCVLVWWRALGALM